MILGSFDKDKRNKDYYFGITQSDDKTGYDIYIVNCSDNMIKVRKEGVGSFITQDESVLMSNSEEKEREFKDLPPQSYLKLSFFDECDLEWTNQYDYTLIFDGKVVEASFTIGRSVGFMGSYLQVLDKWGRKVYV